MPDLTRLRETANRLLDLYGQDATVHVRTGDTFDPATQSNVETITDYSAKVYIGNYNTQARYARKFVTGSLDEFDLRKMICTNIATQPKPGDKVTVGTDEWFILSVAKFIQLNGQDIIYTFEIHG